MKYREFLNSLSNEDFAHIITEDGIFNIACVENAKASGECCFNRIDCYKCVLALLESEADGEIIKRVKDNL